MSDIIDLAEYRKKLTNIENQLGHHLPPELREKLHSIIEEYINKLNSLDHSFEFRGSPEAADIVQTTIKKIRTDYQFLVVELIEKLAAAETAVFLYKQENS